MTTTPKENQPLVVPPASLAKPKAEKKKDERASPRPIAKTQTLAERGGELPIGVQVGAELVKNIVARNWTTRFERELGKQARDKTNLARRVSLVVATMFKKFGPHIWDDNVDIDERKKLLSSMYSADLFYAYCYLRREALGEELKLKIECPKCTHKFEWTADLDTLEIKSPEKFEDLFWTYELRNPVDLRGINVKAFRVGPQRWNAIENSIYDSTEEGMAKVVGVCSSICGFNDSKDFVVLGTNELDEVSKYDFEYLIHEINARFWGPKMGVELQCEKCEIEMAQTIPWSYNDFFSISSR